MQEIIDTIETAFDDPSAVDAATLRESVDTVIARLDDGSVRVAEKSEDGWRVNQWAKKAVLLSFRLYDNV